MKKLVTILIVALMTVVGAFTQPAEHTYRNLTEGDVARLLDGLGSSAVAVHWYGCSFVYNEDTGFFERSEDSDYDVMVIDSFRIYDSECLAHIADGLYETSNGEVRYMFGLYAPGCLERVWSVSVDDMSKVLNYLMYADMIKATDKSEYPDVRTYIELCRNSVGL